MTTGCPFGSACGTPDRKMMAHSTAAAAMMPPAHQKAIV